MAWIKDKLQSPLLLFSLASFYIFLLGIQAISKNVGLAVSVTVVVFFFVVLLIQLLSLKVIFMKFGNALPRFAMLGFLLAANLVAYYLSFSEKFMWMHNLLIALAILLSALIFTVLFRLSSLGKMLSLFFVCSLLVAYS